MEAWRAAWQHRTPRERGTLSIGAIVLALLLGYVFAWEPLRTERERLHRTVPSLRLQWERFATDAAEARRLKRDRIENPRPESMREALEAASARMGLRLGSMVDAGPESITVSVGPLPYESFVRWVGELAAHDGVAVRAVQFEATDVPGTVMVSSLLLHRAERR
jgi:general secretion pathway protein M